MSDCASSPPCRCLPTPSSASPPGSTGSSRPSATPGSCRPENLHVTLAFLGSRPAAELDGILRVLADAASRAERPLLAAARYRETRSVGMVVLADEAGRAARLAGEVGEGLERLGVYERERRKWLPHVTVLRFRRAPRAQPPVPDLGAVSPSEVALYHSVLRPTGAQYEILQSVPLGG